MLDENKKTFHVSSHPSLLPLRRALIAAESGSPARPPRMDVNEQLALQLIARMKTEYTKPLPFESWKEGSRMYVFRLQEAINTNA